MNGFLQWFDQNPGRVLQLFHELHQMPEPGFREYQTSDFLAAQLAENGYTVRRGFAETAVFASREGARPGPHICLRADMDALTFSIGGAQTCIHACGHDANMAEVLSVAIAAAQIGAPACGRLSFLFQPCEEGMLGALRVLQSGILEDVDYLFGTHLRPASEIDTGACPMIRHGAVAVADVKLRGKSAHGGRPWEGVNAVSVGADIVCRVDALPFSPELPYSIKVTQFHSGPGSANIIPADAELSLDIRAQANERMSQLQAGLERAVSNACTKYGAAGEVAYRSYVPAAIESPLAVEAARQGILQVLGPSLLHPPVLTSGGEDFHFYKQRLPRLQATILGFGARMKSGLHKPDMSFDETILPMAAKVLAATALQVLEER